MLKPSYTELMELLNDEMDLDNKITSHYTIVIAAAKRARQIIDGSPYDPEVSKTDKAVSIAVNEMHRGDIQITPSMTDDNDYKYDDDFLKGGVSIGKNVFLADDFVGGFDESVFGKDAGDDDEADDFAIDLGLDDEPVIKLSDFNDDIADKVLDFDPLADDEAAKEEGIDLDLDGLEADEEDLADGDNEEEDLPLEDILSPEEDYN